MRGHISEGSWTLPGAKAEGGDVQKNVDSLAQRIAELEAYVVASSSRVLCPLRLSDEELRSVAISIYRMRLRRQHYFDHSLFAEPAWDMLLDLFINKVRGTRISTTSLALAADVPPTTGLRWVSVLEQHGLLQRYRVPDDSRLLVVEMTAPAYEHMRRCLSESVKRFPIPPPS